MRVTYDPDLFDAGLAVERSPCAVFDKVALAELLGIAPTSLGTLIARGKIPAPDHYQDPDGGYSGGPGAHRRAVWTPEQAAQVLAQRREDENARRT